MTVRAAVLLFPTLVLLVPASAQAQGKPAGKRPNIVLILADDMGYSDLGCYGGEVRTPNLDGLAKNGLRFTNFFNTARCCPSRASLMTGLYPHQAGVGWMVHDHKHEGYRGTLNRNCATIAELLRRLGYGCYMVGKWHLTLETDIKAGVKDTWPTRRGFDRFFGTLTGAGNFYRPATLTRDEESIEAPKAGFYYTDAISDHAVRFVADHRGKRPDDPFFLYVAYTAPHWPLHALKEDVAKYRDVYRKGWDALHQERHARMKKLGLVDPSWTPAPRDKEVPAWDSLPAERKEEMALKMAVYAAMIDRMDQGIGKLKNALAKQGILEDTLILFLADNGACAEGGIFGFERNPGGTLGEADSFASYGQGWAWLSNAIFRLFKHWVHAGGVNTPLIVHWPRGIPQQGTFRRQPGHLIDILATCLDVAGGTYPEKLNGHTLRPLQGKSLVPAFHDRAVERDAIFWEHEGNKAVLKGDWKLVARHPGGWELYDVSKDRSEMHDLAKKRPEVVQDLSARWQAWAERSQVLPLIPYFKQNKKEKKTSFDFRRLKFELQPDADLPRDKAPYLVGRGWTVRVDLAGPGKEGVLVAQGGSSEGFSLFVADGRAKLALRQGGKLTLLAAEAPLPPGAKTIEASLNQDGTLALRIDGEEVARRKGTLARKMPLDGLQVGSDRTGAVGPYAAPFPFTGRITRVVMELADR